MYRKVRGALLIMGQWLAFNTPLAISQRTTSTGAKLQFFNWVRLPSGNNNSAGFLPEEDVTDDS